jgi:hypothetical protein
VKQNVFNGLCPAKAWRRLGLCLLCAAGACGGDDTAAGGSGGGSDGPQGVDACALVTQSDATALFGQPAVEDQEDAIIVDAQLLGECLWTWDTDTSNQLLQLYVWGSREYHSTPDASEPLAVGEDGNIVVSDVLGIDVEWLHGDWSLVLSYSNVGPDVPDVSSRVEPMKMLAATVDDRLGN